MKITITTLSIVLYTCLFSFSAFSQKTSTIKGVVKTADGKAAGFVNIGLKDANRSTVSNEDGSYSLRNIEPGKYSLVTSFVGLESLETEIVLSEGQTLEIDFKLKESSKRLNEVVVSASRANQQIPAAGKSKIKPMDLPQSVQVINSQVINDQQANRLSDVLQNVNGVAYGSNRGGVSGETFFARGYRMGTNDFLKNGMRTTNGGMPEVSSLESVEVLKGSSALMYGGVSSGAVVNMVTKKPKFTSGGEISMRTGSYDLYKPTGDIYGPISDKLAYRLIGSYEKAASYRNNVNADRLYVNPSLLYNLGPKTNILVQGDYLKSDYTPDFGIGTVGNQIVNIGRNAFVNTIWAYNNTNTATSQINVDHKLNDNWQLNIAAGLQNYNRDYFSSERPAADAKGNWTRLLTRSRTKENTYNQQVNLNGNFKTGKIGHTFLVGADADQSSVTAYGFAYGKGYSNNYGTINLLDPSTYNTRTDMPETNVISDTRTPVYRMGTFFQDLISLSDKLKVLGGLRYTFQKIPRSITNTYATGQTTLSNNGINKSNIENVLSPKFGLIYQPKKTTSFYLSYANSFSSNSGIDIYNAPIIPSIIDQYEAGIKNELFKGKITANLTWYKILNNNFAQTALFLADGTPNSDRNIKEITGKTASDGLELDFTGSLAKNFTFLAGYSYNYFRYTQTSEGTGIVEGERIVGSTKNTANASLFYTVNSAKIHGLKLGASAYYTGDRNGGRNTNKIGTTSGIIPLNGFTTFDFSAGYGFRKLSVLAKISNLTDELNYFVHENYSVNPIAPRQFITTLSYKF